MDPLADQLGSELFSLLGSVRGRRVGAGYRVDSGTTERHSVTGREMQQGAGPQAFVSELEPQPLTEDEQALLAGATCGPNGVVAWEASVTGSFSQLVSLRGRTAPDPNNTLATDLLVVDDDGVWLYRPTQPWPAQDERIGADQKSGSGQPLLGRGAAAGGGGGAGSGRSRSALRSSSRRPCSARSSWSSSGGPVSWSSGGRGGWSRAPAGRGGGGSCCGGERYWRPEGDRHRVLPSGSGDGVQPFCLSW
ncbi:MAG: hypothetical protein ACLGIG_11850, partial [Actinomycetes bacterium]